MRVLLAPALVVALVACGKESPVPSKGAADVSQPARPDAGGVGEGAGASHHRPEHTAIDPSQPVDTTPRAMAEMTGSTTTMTTTEITGQSQKKPTKMPRSVQR